ncbi:hypothetical protein [Haladaptatus halobius]|uniref:hypothetical protein n=1 Tax=Haladaptatus halobius TaxID=2884875 RepID=UPI001D0A2400|nr:hypothetical protein [Haladaptatus halobius]
MSQRPWGTIYVSNLIGSAVFAAIGVFVGLELGTIEVTAFGELAHGVLKYS